MTTAETTLIEFDASDLVARLTSEIEDVVAFLARPLALSLATALATAAQPVAADPLPSSAPSPGAA